MTVRLRELTLPVEGEAVPAVSAAVHLPEEPQGSALLLAPGAGGSLDSAPLVSLAEAVAGEGHLVVRANLPYREAGRASPPRAEASVGAYAQILAAARRDVDPNATWFVGGKSYGGRVASLAVAAGSEAAGMVFYGYPLHPPGKPDRLRIEHWPLLHPPCLFLQGTNDPFCDLDLLRANLDRLPAPAVLEVVEGGDHSLRVAAKTAPDGQSRSSERVVADLAPRVSRWMREHATRGGSRSARRSSGTR